MGSKKLTLFALTGGEVALKVKGQKKNGINRKHVCVKRW